LSKTSLKKYFLSSLFKKDQKIGQMVKLFSFWQTVTKKPNLQPFLIDEGVKPIKIFLLFV